MSFRGNGPLAGDCVEPVCHLRRQRPQLAEPSDDPAPMITVSYSARAGSVLRPSSSATRLIPGLTTVLPLTRRITGVSSTGGSGPPHSSSASGVFEVIHRNVT